MEQNNQDDVPSEEQSIAPEVNDSPDQATASPQPVKRKRTKLIWLLVLLILALIAGGVFFYFRHKKTTPIQAASTITKPIAAKQQSMAGYNFYQQPTKLNNLNFFSNTTAIFGTSCNGSQTTNCPPSVTASQISYAQIGLTPSKQPIVVAYDYNIGPSSFAYVAVETTPGHYALNAKLQGLTSTSPQTKLIQANLGPNVSLDLTSTIKPLQFPDSIVINGESYSLPSGFGGPIGYFIQGLPGIRGIGNSKNSLSDIKKVGGSGPYTYYEVTAESHANYEVEEIYAAVGGVYAGAYVSSSPLLSSSAPTINWNGGSVASSTYVSAPQGCGSADGFVVGDNIKPSDLIVAGQGPNNLTVYELATSNPLFKDYYQNYGSGVSYLSQTSLKNLSVQQFQNDHAVIVAKNSLGQYVVYQRTDMFMTGGCGKPVIYLYPKTPTHVNISVGASVAVSSPHYTKYGWRNVYALPSGKLLYRGKAYNNLVWEGTGNGPYPLIDSGTVVSGANVVATIKKQLFEQGFKENEVKDFIDYWQPKLPKTPYVRLTWLSTKEMNTLAPLDITPKPTTLIRAFLDFQGLSHPIPQLKPQTFTAPARKGFTVVEWGGLLAGKLF